MWPLIKKVFSKKDGSVTVLLLDDRDPDSSGSYTIRSSDLIRLAALLMIVALALTSFVFYMTPLGSLYEQYQDNRLNDQLLEISKKVIALSDSLDARDRQLYDLKQVLMYNPDTTFVSQYIFEETQTDDPIEGFVPGSDYGIRTFDMLSQNEIVFSEVLKGVPDFPAAFPVDGEITQEFSVATGHNGIDIAARDNTEFKTIADGTVVNAGWTINYGYVIYVQHGNGYMSVYKHGARLFRKEGDIVLKGDILGIVGDTGLLSFGTHLHFEIWKNGVARNPLMYVIK